MRRTNRVLALLALCGAVPGAACAADLRGAFVAGYDTGGDKLVTVSFTNGDTRSIRGNQGFYAGGGFSVLNDDKNVELLGTLAFKFASVSGDNGDVTFTRLPVDLLAFYRWQNFRLGGGLTYVISPTVRSNLPGNANVNIDNAAGLVVQGDYLLGRVAIGLRYTALDYKVFGNTIKASGIGLSFGFTFGGSGN